jgi:hypothetical protein
MMKSELRTTIENAPVGSWFSIADCGGRAADQTLSRMARDPKVPLVRAAKGLYYRTDQPDRYLGKRSPSPVETARRVAVGRGVGPAGATAASFLGLTTQVAPIAVLTVSGTPPVGVDGVVWCVRKNPRRADLDFAEVAVVEVLATFPYGVEADWERVVSRISGLVARSEISIARIRDAVRFERRSPTLRSNFTRLEADLGG